MSAVKPERGELEYHKGSMKHKRNTKGKGKERAMEVDKVKRERGAPGFNSNAGSRATGGCAEAMKLDEVDTKPFPLHLLPPLPLDARAAAAFPTPDATPLASASSSFAFPPSPTTSSYTRPPPATSIPTSPPSPARLAGVASPLIATPPASPSRQHERFVIPLDRLVAVGTIRLENYVLNDAAKYLEAEDGWEVFGKDSLQALPPPFIDEDEQLALLPFPTTPKSFSGQKGRAKSGTKRKAASSNRSPPAKKAKPSGHAVLDSLVSLTSALATRATMRVVGTTAILRVYLVPQDLPELADPAYTRGRTKWPPGSTVFQVLNAIRMSEEEWEGGFVDGDVPRFMDEQDKRSLLEVYRNIESPSHDDAFIDQLNTSDETKDRLRWALHEGAEGIETDMFPYQKATLAKMLARELAPQPVPHPSFIRCTSLLDPSRHLFISLEGSIRNKPHEVVEAKGGILAEDMGVGKTLIVLSLIISTLSELPKLDGVSTYLDDSLPSPPPVLLTDVSLDFPFPAEIAEAKKLRPRVPEPLAGYAMDVREEEEYLEALEKQAEEDARVESYPLPSLRSLMVHHIKTSTAAIRYPVDDSMLQTNGLLDLLQKNPPFYRTFPSPAQLDSREGRKGRYQRGDVVVAATTLVVVPTDLVRQWTDEVNKHAPGALRTLVLRTKKDKFPTSAAELASYDLVLMSVARFSDAAEADNTSLRGVHWRRLVVDEGHALSSGNRMRKLAEELRCESRWAVSGTPSTNLRGAQEGAEGALFAPANTAGGDRVDLERLGQLFSRFIKHAAFPRPDSLRKLVQTHVLDSGERPYRLSSVLDRAVIRHDHSLIKQSFKLPPLTSRIVYIEMEEAERRTYNALVALFSSNSITSQRVDQDYLFHAQQRKHLDTLCDNLACASFFFGSDEFFGQLSDARAYVEKRLYSPSSIKWTKEERAGLAKTVEVYTEVLKDRESQLTSGAPGVAFEVEGLNTDLASPFLALTASKNPRGRVLVSQSQLVRLRVNLKELRREDVKAWDDDEELVEELITFEEKRKRLEAVPKGQAPEVEDPPLFKKRGKKDETPVVPLPDDSCFKDIRLVRTTSAKINHIVGELLRYPDEKFIIFSSSIVDIVFANLSETLDLLGIRHAIFAGSHARADRGLTAQRFNSTSARECQAILVDAKLGGRGITLTAASRVICIEPIWRPDLEVQAAKRAHRLGQTRRVDMQTLVVRNTYEDALLRRRSELAPEDFAKKVKLPQQDNHLRSLLQAAQYLEPAAAAKEGKPVSKALEPTVRLIRD
ncbi:hypothetical protein JCM11251_000361 [Rhodosporidiobolus azoricus]